MQHYISTIEKAKAYIAQNIEKVTPEAVSVYCNYSSKQLYRIFSLYTGMTLGEYIRWIKLAKAFFEVKLSETPLIDIALKYGYDTQEGFTRAFKDNFAVTPGEYRKTRQSITAKNWHVNDLIHQESHNAANEGLFVRGNVDHWMIVKPERLWVSLRKNSENLPAHKFYDLCGEEGVMRKIASFPHAVGMGGAYFTMTKNCLLSFGIEVETSYPHERIREYEVMRIPQSRYVVFNYPKYSIEEHGDAIRSTWGAQRDFDIESYGLRWDFDHAPVFEDDDGDLGYILWFPVCDATEDDILS